MNKRDLESKIKKLKNKLKIIKEEKKYYVKLIIKKKMKIII